MKILHIALASSFTEGMAYQENVLTDLNCEAGHDVTIVTNAAKYVHGEVVETEEEDRRLENGLRLIRLKYDRVINSYVSGKIQKCRRVRDYLNEIQPDSILYHGCNGYELMDVAEYAKEHPEVLFYVDSHAEFYNSAKTAVSKLFYRYIHGRYVKKALPYVKKVLPVCIEAEQWLEEVYGLPKDVMEIFLLGGLLVSPEEQKASREQLIQQYQLPEDAIIFSHSGKMSRSKKTRELLRAFRRVDNDKARLLIFGSFPEEDQAEMEKLMAQDDRVLFLGWKVADEQRMILGGTDVYCQPGAVSATSENASCAGCAMLLNDIPDYRDIYGDAGTFCRTEEDIFRLFDRYARDLDFLQQKKDEAYAVAEDKLDYRKLAERYLH